jgi:hypothetical protein
MSNPDSTRTGANIGGIATLGGFVVILVIILFNYYKASYFNALLYGGLPIIIYVLMFVVLYISKKNTNVKNAFLSAVPTIGTTYLALFISYISYFRIPVASVFAPLFLDSTANIVSQTMSDKTSTNTPNASLPLTISKGGSHKKFKKQSGGSCCNPTFSLDVVEEQFPTIKGISYGFYLFFAICFGGVFGSSMPSI